jgi:GT2 family glycosyltransferase
MKNKIIDAFIFNYNGTKTVLSTIDSLYNSVEVDIKITIIDDHSTDNSLELIRTK